MWTAVHSHKYNIKAIRSRVTDGWLKIDPAPLTITVNGNTAKKVYNGSLQTFKGAFTASSSDQGFDAGRFTYTGSTTASGTNVGEYTTDPEEGSCSYKDDNYTITWVMGDPVKLTITPASVKIRVTGHTDTVTYDGQEHIVEGYDLRSGSGLYEADKVTLSGQAVAKGTDASDDKYMMGLTASQFSYDDSNVTVVFEITDGWLKIIETKPYKLTDPVLPENDPPAEPVPQTTDDPTNQKNIPEITTKQHYYEVYQIFTGDYAAVPVDPADESQGTRDVLSNIVWGANGCDPGRTVHVGDPVDQSVIDALEAVREADLDRTKLDEIERYVVLTGEPFATITLGPGDTESHIQLPAGYYLIRDEVESQTGRFDAYTTYITVVIKDYTIQPKSVIPTVDKQVYEDPDGGAHREGWAETADHAINETFQFALIGTIPENTHLKDYTEEYIVKFTDTMSQGVTFENIAYVTVNDTEVAPNLYTAAYTEENTAADNTGNEPAADPSGTPADSGSEDPAEDSHHTLTIAMNLKAILGDDFGSGGIKVVVVYNAHLNEKAITHVESSESTTTNDNTVYMEYSNNPNTGFNDDRGKTASDTVWVFTYEADALKVDENQKPLAGAGFVLFEGDNPVKMVKDSTDGTTYYVAPQTEAAQAGTGDSGTDPAGTDPAGTGQSGNVEIVTEMITDSTGLIHIRGLDIGRYTLRETIVPPGYNSVEDTIVEITASHGENNDRSTVRLELRGDNRNATIVNQSGTALPSTGGPGTLLYYLIGTILILGGGNDTPV